MHSFFLCAPCADSEELLCAAAESWEKQLSAAGEKFMLRVYAQFSIAHYKNDMSRINFFIKLHPHVFPCIFHCECQLCTHSMYTFTTLSARIIKLWWANNQIACEIKARIMLLEFKSAIARKNVPRHEHEDINFTQLQMIVVLKLLFKKRH